MSRGRADRGLGVESVTDRTDRPRGRPDLAPGDPQVQTTTTIRNLAARIETSYYQRHEAGTIIPDRAWSIAARMLLAARQFDPELPIDPVLFVACVAPRSAGPSAWKCLIRRRAIRTYVLGVRAVVRGLRRELEREVKRVEARVLRGQPIEMLLTWPSSRVSPLGRYIAAHRAGRPELAKALRPQARRQHEACPLYRQASEPLLPWGGYPADDVFELLTTEVDRDRDPHSSPARN